MGSDGSDGGGQQASSRPYWRLEIDKEKCSLCEVCARCCSSGAIRSEAAKDTLAILFSHELCDGCRDCLKDCPEDAILLTGIEASPAGSGWKVLAAGEMLRCSVCAAYFAPFAKLQAASQRRGPDTDLIREQCPLCRRTQMVARFIDENREAVGRKAEYRTGKKWSWKPAVEGDPDAPPCSEVLGRPADQDTPE